MLSEERIHFHISVRNLVEFVLKSGDIDDRYGDRDPVLSMREGQRIHKMIQRKQASGYVPEVPLKYLVTFEKFEFELEGRADGVIYDINTNLPICVDEIKGMYMNLDDIEEPLPLHIAQAKCYAYILCVQNNLEKINIRMTYCNLDTDEIKMIEDEYSLTDLQEFFDHIWSLYKRWAEFEYDWIQSRNASILEMSFPFEYRDGQKKLIASVYKTIVDEKINFIEAPTGAGKTISTIYPSVQALGRGLIEKIFYLTSKTITKSVAVDTFKIFQREGTPLKVVSLTAKDRICFLEERKCNPDDCIYAKGHLDRVNDAVYDLLISEDIFSEEKVIEYAKKHRVCPFEFSLDLSLWCDAIIGDYNYVFNPTSYLKRFFADGVKKDYVFLMDEAHNLVDRGRDMYSESLVKEDFLSVRALVKNYDKRLYNYLGKCNQIILRFKKENPDFLRISDVDEFSLMILNLKGQFERFFQKRIHFDGEDVVRDFYFRVRNFSNLLDYYDDHYLMYAETDSEGKYMVHLSCMDPSNMLQERLDKARACVFFSATLLPLCYYKKLLCTEENPTAVYAETIFRPEQSLIVSGVDVTSKYKSRSDEMYDRYARYIYEITNAKSGNYFVFFPSYKLMNDVLFHFEAYNNSAEILVQNAQMTEDEKKQFLETFRSNREKTLIGFCVIGGMFSEGIDLTGESLIGVIICGMALPMVCRENELLREYFEGRRRGSGFSYAYLYPGMCKVLQAAGRLIRTEDDRGVIALLDERFRSSEYKSIFPKHWGSISTVNVNTVKDTIGKFWEE